MHKISSPIIIFCIATILRIGPNLGWVAWSIFALDFLKLWLTKWPRVALYSSTSQYYFGKFKIWSLSKTSRYFWSSLLKVGKYWKNNFTSNKRFKFFNRTFDPLLKFICNLLTFSPLLVEIFLAKVPFLHLLLLS